MTWWTGVASGALAAGAGGTELEEEEDCGVWVPGELLLATSRTHADADTGLLAEDLGLGIVACDDDLAAQAS